MIQGQDPEIKVADDYQRPDGFKLVMQGQLDRITDTKLDLSLVELYAALGLTQYQIALLHKVSVRTIQNWKQMPAFLEAMRKGSLLANTEVIRSLYKRAVGYTYTVTVHEVKAGARNDGKDIIVNREETVHVPPDVTAIQYYLNNKDKENWQPLNKLDLTIRDRKVLVKELLEMDEEELEKLAKQKKN